MIIVKVGVHQHIMVRWWLTLMMVVVSLVCTNNMCRLTIKSGRYTIYKATSIPSKKSARGTVVAVNVVASGGAGEERCLCLLTFQQFTSRSFALLSYHHHLLVFMMVMLMIMIIVIVIIFIVVVVSRVSSLLFFSVLLNEGMKGWMDK